jgi:ribosomal protein L18E
MYILLNAIHRLNKSLLNIAMTLFKEIETTILKFMQKHKRSQITKVNLSKIAMLGCHDI